MLHHIHRGLKHLHEATGLARHPHIRDAVLAFGIAVSILYYMVNQIGLLDASGIIGASDVVTNAGAGAFSNHEIKFISSSGLLAAGTFSINFVGGTANPFSIGAVDYSDIDLAISSGNCEAAFTETDLAFSPGGATWGVGIIGNEITFTSGTDIIPAGRCVRVLIGTNAITGGVGANRITNPVQPATSGNPIKIDIIAGPDTGSIALGIADSSSVSVTASVLPYMSVTVLPVICDMGTLSKTTLSACSYVLTVSSSTGYSTTIADLTAPVAFVNIADGVTTIPATDGMMTIGTSEYGVAVSNANPAVEVAYQDSAGCLTGNPGLNTDASALTGAEQIIAQSDASVASDMTTICHKATIVDGQAPGDYRETVTLTTIALF